MANYEDVFTVQALVTGSDKTTVEVTSQIIPQVNEADKRITSIIKHSLFVISMDFLLYNSVTKVTI